jgi:hypothetical protein
VPLSSGPHYPIREGSDAATWLTTLDFASSGESSGAVMCPMALNVPWAMGIKKGIAALGAS